MIAGPIRQALDHGERPDPALGILETIRVENGVLQQLEAHRARMSTSARALYGVDLSRELAELSPPELSGSVRLRVSFTPTDALRIEHGPRPADPVYAQIAPFVLPGGLGSHKWADRRLVDALASVAEGALPLLLDADGSVLEATWASVLIEEHGRLISPPQDHRALAGIGRRRLRYDEEPVQLDRLLAADAVILASALRTLRISIRLI